MKGGLHARFGNIQEHFTAEHYGQPKNDYQMFVCNQLSDDFKYQKA